MENISSRHAARIAGYFDLIWTITSAVILIGLTYIWLETDPDSKKDSSFNIFIGIGTIVIGLSILLYMLLSILLLKATNLSADPKKSLKRVNVWLAINIFLLVSNGVKGFLRGDWITVVVLLCIRGPLILLVQCFKRDLARHCVDQPSIPQPNASVETSVA